MRKISVLALTIFLLVATSVAAQAQGDDASRPDELGVGIFTFTSGPAAAYGQPGYNAAEVLIKNINENGGIGGVPIHPTFVDEAQGTEGVISQFKKLSSDKANKVMIAALSSSNCLALAPIAEQMEEPMIGWNCDTYQLLNKDRYKYVFRANTSVIPEFLAYVVYLLQTHENVDTVAMIGPDYALGHDAAKITKAALNRFSPDTKVVANLFPSLGTSNFLTDITRLAASHPDVVFVNLWGGDLTSFIDQAISRGLFNRSQFVITMGNTVLQSMGQKFPNDVIIGNLGDGYWLSKTAQSNGAAETFISDYHERFGKYPTFPAFKMTNAILAMKDGYEKAMADNGGTWPTKQELLTALSGLDVKTLTGALRIRKQDHDGVVNQLIGVSGEHGEHPYKVFTDVAVYPGKKLTPPAGADPYKWISNLPDGFLSQLPQPDTAD